MFLKRLSLSICIRLRKAFWGEELLPTQLISSSMWQRKSQSSFIRKLGFLFRYAAKIFDTDRRCRCLDNLCVFQAFLLETVKCPRRERPLVELDGPEKLFFLERRFSKPTFTEVSHCRPQEAYSFQNSQNSVTLLGLTPLGRHRQCKTWTVNPQWLV